MLLFLNLIIRVVLPFMLLPFWWAIFNIVFLEILMPIFTILMPHSFITYNFKLNSLIFGGTEAAFFIGVIIFLLMLNFDIPIFSPILIILGYTTTQFYRTQTSFSRYLKSGEIIGLLGFYAILIFFLIVISLFR